MQRLSKLARVPWRSGDQSGQRPRLQWRLRTRSLELGERTLVMGVVNITPDSFSDGGRYLAPELALAHAVALLQEGADILDIGGESTRPGKKEPVSAQQEIDRVLPVIEQIMRGRPGAVISVDTYKAEVARVAAAAGAEIVNDVSGLRWDAGMAKAVSETGCGVVLMHMRGRPEQWRTLPRDPHIFETVRQESKALVREALQAGIQKEHIAIDPGFGFGKNFEENYPLLQRLAELGSLGYPVVCGTSRKSFIGRTLARDGKDASVAERLFGTVASVTACILNGAHVVRVHNVKPAVDAARIADAILRG